SRCCWIIVPIAPSMTRMRSPSAASSAATRSGLSQGSCFMGWLRALLLPLQGEGRDGDGVCPGWEENHPHPTLPLKGRALKRCRRQGLSWLLRDQRDHLEVRWPLLAGDGLRVLDRQA